MITLDIISDPICPWCYIGKANLMQALEAAPDHPFLLRWRPFQLNPDMPAEGMDRRQYLEEKFGGPEKVDQLDAHVREVAAKAGLTIDYARIPRTPNTIDAHRLIRWAGHEGKQTAVAQTLFTAFFEGGRDISDHAVLADVAERAGMDRTMVERLLASDADLEEVRAEDAEARRIGVTGVPTFIVADRYAVVGAQPPEVWAQAIAELKQAEDQS